MQEYAMEAQRILDCQQTGQTPVTGLADAIRGYSIEVQPRTAAKVESFRDLLPAGTLVYIANVEGTDFNDMIHTARRIRADGFDVMPHFPARLIKNRETLETWIRRYREEADVNMALLLGGGISKPVGDYHSSIQLMETGLFDANGFKRLHVAGHPEGNKDIDKDGSTKIIDEALQWKQGFSEQTDAEMAIATQFFFATGPAFEWIRRIREQGVTLPVHIGVSGPNKLQNLIKFAIMCGVGPSVAVLKKRALDFSKLLLPYEPTDILEEIADFMAEHPEMGLEKVHFFPLGGIKTCVAWADAQMNAEARAGAA